VSVITVQFLYFAAVRERLKRDGQTAQLPAGTRAGDALKWLAGQHEHLEPLLDHLQVAVNQQVVPRNHLLEEGDEVALLPPVAGGTGHTAARVAVRDEALSLDAVVAAVSHERQGGIVTFTGVVRRKGQLEKVQRLEYEAYVPMAEKVLAEIAAEIEREWPQTRTAIHHRIGHLAVGEIAVVIAVSAPHRAEAFAGCRAIIERLKQRVPIWKKEIAEDGESWIGLGP